MPAWMRQWGTSAAVLAVAAAGAVAGASREGFTDLFVYRYAGDAVLHGRPVYGPDDPVTGLPFTYPPFAAIVLAPLGPMPAWLAAAVWSGLSMAALAAVVVVGRRAARRPAPGWFVVVVCVAALGLEPVWQNWTFGQVNTMLMLAVLVDLLRPERRLAGVLVGVAAGVKLTPLVFIVLLLLVGRRAAAGRASAAFAATVIAGFVVMPSAAAAYWTDDLLRGSRVGPPSLAHNQSVLGAMTRLGDGVPPTWSWLLLTVPVAAAVLMVAARTWRSGDRLLGTGLGALAMLLASPVSWSHHWVWAVPIALALWERNRGVAVAWTAVFVARPIVWPPWGERREYGWNAVDHVVGNGYLLAALAVTAFAALAMSRPSVSTRSTVNSCVETAWRSSSMRAERSARTRSSPAATGGGSRSRRGAGSSRSPR